MASQPSFHLLALIILPFLLSVDAQAPVLDSDGDALQRGRLYYAESIFRGAAGGGLTLVAANETCPSHVAKAPPLDWRGRALSFFPENATAKTVTAGATLYIRFAFRPTCSRSSAFWQANRGGRYVTTGGSASSAVGPHSSRFAISRGDGGGGSGGYQIRLCPCSVGVDRASCRMGCLGALGVTSSRLLGVGAGRPHLVTFVKAK